MALNGSHGHSDPNGGSRSAALRVNLFFFGTFVVFSVLLIRLAVLQFVEGPTLSEVEASQNTKNVPLASIRGTIYAAGGEKLAYSTPVQSLYMTLTREYTLKQTDEETGETVFTPEAAALTENLTDKLMEGFQLYGDPNGSQLSKEDIIEALDLNFRKFNGYTPRRIKSGLTDKEVAYFMEHKSEFPGMVIVEENERHYDEDTVASQTVGYVKQFRHSNNVKGNTLNMYKNILRAMRVEQNPGLMYRDEELVGFDGLELQYQRELRGENSYQVTSVNPQNMAEKVEEIIAPVKGHDIWTTIDKGIQMKTEQAILDQLDWLHRNPVQGKLHPDAITGYAVAMEVETGNIVAIASMPDYDTNMWASGSISTENFNEIMTNYQNGAITPYSSGKSGHNFDSTVFLGSTIKPLTVLIGLDQGFFTTSYTYSDRGSAVFGRAGYETTVRNASGHVLGPLRPGKAIEKSSNAFMIDMIGKPLYRKYQDEAYLVWDEYMKQFGLGVSTGSKLPNEYLGSLDYRKEAEEGKHQSAMVFSSFGQQGKYTPLQLAQYTATLANRGERIRPQLVSKITDAEGNVVQTFGREVLNTVDFKPAYWDEVIKGMNSTVNAFNDFPYDFARKTGTSQQEYFGNKQRQNIDNGVFIAFAPRQNPKLAVAVVIPSGGFGSSSAAPVARKIFDAYDWEYGLDGVPKKSLTPPPGQEGGADNEDAGT